MNQQKLATLTRIKPCSLKLIFCILLVFSSTASFAKTIVLSEGNGYQALVDEGIFLDRDLATGIGPIQILGGEFAIGPSDEAMFPGQTQIGGMNFGGSTLGGFRPIDLAKSAIPFTIRANDTGNLYDVILSYFLGRVDSGGLAPDDIPSASAVFQITPATPVPIPAAGWLILSALVTLGFFRNKRS